MPEESKTPSPLIQPITLIRFFLEDSTGLALKELAKEPANKEYCDFMASASNHIIAKEQIENVLAYYSFQPEQMAIDIETVFDRIRSIVNRIAKGVTDDVTQP